MAAPPASGCERDSEAKAYASGKLNTIMMNHERSEAGPATVAALDDTNRMPDPRMAATYSAIACGKVIVAFMAEGLPSNRKRVDGRAST